jgi:DNA-binding response OmpR family regulator
MVDSVLVVDDETDFLKTYERLLRRRGYMVIAVATRSEALDVVRSTPLGLVIADVKLPDGDGLDIVREARAAPVPPPIIVVTGFASDANQQQALEAGASAYLAKPFSVSTFTTLVDRLAAPRTDRNREGGIA